MKNDEDLPLVAIGMPTYNREWSLDRVLESVLGLDYDRKRIRICFVDNNSSDRTVSMIEAFSADHGAEYEGVLLEVRSSNISKARNIAFEMAKGCEYIYFLDSDILVPPDALKRLLSSFKSDSRVGMVSLPWDQKNARKRAGTLFRAFDSPVGPHQAYKVGNGCNLISMRAAQEAGYFDERLRVHEDGEFCYRLRRKGYKIICDSSSEGTHLREIKVNAGFYLSFLKDSAETYKVMLSDGSLLHIGKVASSLLLIVSLVLLLVLRSLPWAVLFAGIVVFAIWLNASSLALDDGSHVRLAYRPLIGAIFTITTVMITILVLTRPTLPRRPAQ